MTRRGRYISSTRIHHIIVQGLDHQLLFEEPKDYSHYLDLMEYYKEECNYEIFAYCLMSNHVHILIRHSEDVPLSAIFQRINTSYAGWFNAKYKRTGYLFGSRYHSEPVEDKRYLLQAIRYIHFNPTKAGLEDGPGKKYPWNSYSIYQDAFIDDSQSLVDTSYILGIAGGRDNLMLFHKSKADEIECMDVEQFRRRLPDDIAKDIIEKISSCSTSAEFQKFSIKERNEYLRLIHKEGVSVRQLNRLTGVPKGIVERVLTNRLKAN